MSDLRRGLDILLFAIVGFISIGLAILPLGFAADSIAFPDLLYCVMVAWVIRRPETAPIVIVAGIGLLADAMMMRPVGLWALMLLLGTEALRINERAFREIPFLLEWAYVSGLLILLTILQYILLLITFSDTYDFGLSFWHILRTILIYPFVVLTLRWVFRVRVPKPNERPNQLGYKT